MQQRDEKAGETLSVSVESMNLSLSERNFIYMKKQPEYQ
jgi:hypothetical protein